MLSYAQSLPILLTTPSALSPRARTAMLALGIKQVIVMGGPFAVSDSVVTQLEAFGVSVLRIAGATAVATSVELASFETAPAPDAAGWTGTGSVVVARGNFYADGLAGAVVAADGPSSALPEPLLLTASPVTIGTPLVEFIESAGCTGIGGKQVSTLTVLGGPGALDRVHRAVVAWVGRPRVATYKSWVAPKSSIRHPHGIDHPRVAEHPFATVTRDG